MACIHRPNHSPHTPHPPIPSNSYPVFLGQADYDFANKEVAILCNHQRAIPKSHDNQMTKLREKVEAAQHELEVG